MGERKGISIRLDDGRVTLIIGSVILLIYCVATATMEEMKYSPLWTFRLILEFLRDLGIASIVGGIVSLGIERISREHFQHEISTEIKNIEKNMINAAYSKRYPKEYTDLVVHMLSKFNYFKYKLDVTIDLVSPVIDIMDYSGECLIYYSQTMSYWVHNMSDADDVIQPRIFVDDMVPGHAPSIVAWSIGEHSLSEEELHEVERESRNFSDQRWYQFPRAVTVPANRKLYVYSRIKNLKHRRDVTTWCGIVPADGLKFTINHPKDFYAYAQPKLLGRPRDSPFASDGERVVVEIFTPILPYTTVELGWRPILSSRSQNEPETSGTTLPMGGSKPMSGSIQEISNEVSSSSQAQSRRWRWW